MAGWWRRLMQALFVGPDPDPTVESLEGERVKLVVGLGNLEPRYDNTRHNVGFEVVDRLAADHQAEFSASRLPAQVCSIRPRDGDRIVLARPTTLMNRSGFAVTQLLEYYKLEADDLLVVCDDFNLDLGTLRLRGSGSHGGQNGLRHIIQQLGHQNFARLRCGIGPAPRNANTSNFVLGRFKSSERPTVDDMVERAAICTLTWNTDGVEAAQQRYNGTGD